MYKSFLFLLLSASLALTPIITYGADGDVSIINDYAYLDKLSKTLTGTPPTKEEFEQLRFEISNNNQNAFFDKKIDEYLSSQGFYIKMVDRVRELFRIPGTSSTIVPYTQLFNGTSQSVTRNNYNYSNFSNQIYSMLASSNTWDSLFTTQYRTSNNEYSQAQIPVLSSEFLSKYPTSELNRNRKRAAVIFRTLLCDTMRPAVEVSENISEQESNVLFSDSHITNSNGKPVSNIDEHGQRADCKACHRKLDPMGRALPDYPEKYKLQQPMALVIDTQDGRKVEIRVNSIQELLIALTKQPEYLSCQVKHFYEWFLGPIETLTPDRMTALAYEFNKFSRKPIPFIKSLVQSKEFKTKSLYKNVTPEQRTAMRIRGILTQCNSCHAGLDGFNPWISSKDLTKLVDGKFAPAVKNEVIDRMTNVLNGKGEITMPPSYSDWQLTKEQRAEIINYISTLKDKK